MRLIGQLEEEGPSGTLNKESSDGINQIYNQIKIEINLDVKETD